MRGGLREGLEPDELAAALGLEGRAQTTAAAAHVEDAARRRRHERAQLGPRVLEVAVVAVRVADPCNSAHVRGHRRPRR